MKLAEALMRRKALKESIEQLKLRLTKVAKVQEGDTPAERPQELLTALEADLQELQTLIIRINRANLRATLPDGTTLMEGIATRDVLKLRRSLLEALANSALPLQDRFTRTELKYVPTVDVAELRQEVDRLSKAYRELDATLQVPGHPEVSVVGDLAYVEEGGSPLPMVAPVAMQQGRHVARNIALQVKGRPAQPFDYRDPGMLATIGRNAAVAYLPGLAFTGFPAWLLWLGIHIVQLIGFRNRLVVLVSWAWDYIFYERAVRIVIPQAASPVRPVREP